MYIYRQYIYIYRQYIYIYMQCHPYPDFQSEPRIKTSLSDSVILTIPWGTVPQPHQHHNAACRAGVAPNTAICVGCRAQTLRKGAWDSKVALIGFFPHQTLTDEFKLCSHHVAIYPAQIGENSLVRLMSCCVAQLDFLCLLFLFINMFFASSLEVFLQPACCII